MDDGHDQPLKDYAQEYIDQILSASDNEIRLLRIKEFGEKAYARGWKAALEVARSAIDRL